MAKKKYVFKDQHNLARSRFTISDIPRQIRSGLNVSTA